MSRGTMSPLEKHRLDNVELKFRKKDWGRERKLRLFLDKSGKTLEYFIGLFGKIDSLNDILIKAASWGKSYLTIKEKETLSDALIFLDFLKPKRSLSYIWVELSEGSYEYFSRQLPFTVSRFMRTFIHIPDIPEGKVFLLEIESYSSREFTKEEVIIHPNTNFICVAKAKSKITIREMQ